MNANAGAEAKPTRGSCTALEWANFFVADVQSGVGPFLASYLATRAWSARDIGFALTLGGLVTVAVQTPAGAYVDRCRFKRGLFATAVMLCALGALLIGFAERRHLVLAAQAVIGVSAAFILPTLAAMTLGLVGKTGFDRQFGTNQAFNAAGNVVSAVLLAAVAYLAGIRNIFFVTALLAVPTWVAISRVRGDEIDFDRSRGDGGGDGPSKGDRSEPGSIRQLVRDRVLVTFLGCAFLFHLANAAMLPQLGELLARNDGPSGVRMAAPFMSACIIVTQLVISGSARWVGRLAGRVGRRPLLLLGFGVCPVRAVLYTLTHRPGMLIGIQILDGVANAIFGVVAVLVIANRAQGTGRFNLAGAGGARHHGRPGSGHQPNDRRGGDRTCRLQRIVPQPGLDRRGGLRGPAGAGAGDARFGFGFAQLIYFKSGAAARVIV